MRGHSGVNIPLPLKVGINIERRPNKLEADIPSVKAEKLPVEVIQEGNHAVIGRFLLVFNLQRHFNLSLCHTA